MRKIILMIVAVLAFVTVSAQPPQGGPMGGQRGGDRNARTIEMLQKQLNMSPEQAKKFAPVYQGYMRELRQVRKDTKTLVDSYKNDELTIKVAKKIMLAQLNGKVIAPRPQDRLGCLPCARTQLQNRLACADVGIRDQIGKQRGGIPRAVFVKLVGDRVEDLSKFHS